MYYQLKFNRELYQSLVVEVDELFDRMGDNFGFLDATPRLSSWKAPHAMLCSLGNARSAFMPGISEWLGQPVLSPQAFTLLQPLLQSCCEFLPVHCNDQLWFILNLLKVESPVDRQLSKRSYLNGEMTGAEKLVFNASYQISVPLFKINYDEKVGIYCSHEFKHLVEEEGLSGFSFILIETNQAGSFAHEEFMSIQTRARQYSSR